jgi:hypothetical protein
MAAHLIAIRRPAMHAGDLLPHPPPQLLAARWRHDASVGAGIRWMGRRTSPVRRTARPLGGLAHCRDGTTPSGSCAAHAPPGHPDAHGPAAPGADGGEGDRRTSGCTWTGHLSRITAMRAASGAAARRSGEQGASVARPIIHRRPPGDHLTGPDVQPAHAAQVALGRPTPFRPHRIGACPSIPVGQGRAPGDRDGTRSTVTPWVGCARASAPTSAIACRLAGSWGSGRGPCLRARCQGRPNRSRMRAIPRSAAARLYANGLRTASRVPHVWVRPHGRGSRRTSCSTAVAAVAGAWRSGGTRGRAPASVPDGKARAALGVPAIQPVSDGFRMARTQHACARRDSGRHAGRAAQERCRLCTHRGRGGMIAQVVAGLPLRDGHVKGPACRQRTLLSKACHGWISGERNIFSKSISPRLCKAKPACADQSGIITQRP